MSGASPEEPEEDPFADSDEWIAAEGRQFFRALDARDPKAVEVAQFYLCNFLEKTLGRHLHKRPRWQFPRLWFDGLDATDLDVEPPARLRIAAWLVCVAGPHESQDWWREPFEFDLRLCPRTGQFRGYRFRVGDTRPRDAKRIVGLEIGMAKRIELSPFRVVELPRREPVPVGGWLEEIIRGEFPAESQRPNRSHDLPS